VQSSRKVSTNACKVTSGHTYEQLQVMFFLLHLWSAIVCMCRQLQVISYFFRNFWTAIIRTYKRLQAMFYFICGVQLFIHANNCKSSHILDCNHLHVRKIASFLFIKKIVECNRLYMQTIGSHLIFYFLNLWTAIVCTYE
jgi:hypothetical protein